MQDRSSNPKMLAVWLRTTGTGRRRWSTLPPSHRGRACPPCPDLCIEDCNVVPNRSRSRGRWSSMAVNCSLNIKRPREARRGVRPSLCRSFAVVDKSSNEMGVTRQRKCKENIQTSGTCGQFGETYHPLIIYLLPFS